MTLTPDDLEIMAFDPPHLGMPGRPSHCGRAENGCGFVEIFVAVEGDRIIDVGFLTSIPGDGMVCASVCCQTLLDKTLDDALNLDTTSILGCFPEPMWGNHVLAELTPLCISAARLALHGATRTS